MPWGAIAGAVIAGGASIYNGEQNRNAASNAAGQTFNSSAPYNIDVNGDVATFGLGTNASATPSTQLAGLQQGFFGGAGNAIGNVNSGIQNGNISPLLASALGSYYGSTPNYGSIYGGVPNAFFGNQGMLQGLTNATGGLAGQYLGNASNPNQIQDYGLGQSFSNASTGLLGQLGNINFNPQQFGSQYANLLGQQQAPANQLAANNLAQSLFNTGNLGSTGGANQLGQLQMSQQNQMIGDQIAGQQLGMQGQQLGLQAQGLMGSLAGQYGQLGSGITQGTALANSNLTGQALNQYSGLLGGAFNANAAGTGALFNQNQALFGNQLNLANAQQQQANQGLQAFLGTNTAGNQNLATQLSLASGLFGQGMDINQYLQGLISQGSQLGANRAGTGTAAAQTQLMGNLAANNAMGGFLNSLGNINWGGLFGGAPNSIQYQNNLQNGGGGVPMA